MVEGLKIMNRGYRLMKEVSVLLEKFQILENPAVTFVEDVLLDFVRGKHQRV
jgi:hypothetical protein